MSDFETYEARSLARDYGLAEAIEAAESLGPVRPIEVIEGEILFYTQVAGEAVVEIGRRLIEAKENLEHGQWERWLEEKVGFSVRSAQNYMRLAKGYSESATVARLGTRKALVLLALEDSERSDFVAENDVENMTAKELEEAVRLKKEAEEKSRDLEDKLKTQQARTSAAEAEKQAAMNKAAMAEDARKRLETELQAAKAKAKTETSAAQSSQQEAEKLRRELEDLRKKPVDVAVREPTGEELAKLTASAVDAAQREKQAEIDALKKQLSTADPATAAFKIRFEEWQLSWQKMTAALAQVEKEDATKADKLRSAVRAALQSMGA